ncbi:MAG: hypothetical protein R3C41_05860 [Calditrichia bacterium]|nr:hypothetical protein [Calditrichota bacterium]MCB9069971.1 hypothetical protein [Calditrichia bacterium]
MMLNKIFIISFTVAIAAFLLSCSESPTDSGRKITFGSNYAEGKGEFPEAYLSSGSDRENTFRSLKSIRNSDGSLALEVSGWGIREMGIMCRREIENETLRLSITHFCGTVQTLTPEKVKFDQLVTLATEDSLSRIVFIATGDSLVLEKR